MILNGGKDDDVLIADQGNDTLTGGADGDDFVFGNEIWDQGPTGDEHRYRRQCHHRFDDDNGDRIVFHTDFEGTLSASVEGDDVLIESSLGGSVLVEGLVSEMEGIDPTDTFFDEDSLIDFLTKTGEYEEDAGKGIITFEDVHVELPHIDPDQAETISRILILKTLIGAFRSTTRTSGIPRQTRRSRRLPTCMSSRMPT